MPNALTLIFLPESVLNVNWYCRVLEVFSKFPIVVSSSVNLFSFFALILSAGWCVIWVVFDPPSQNIMIFFPLSHTFACWIGYRSKPAPCAAWLADSACVWKSVLGSVLSFSDLHKRTWCFNCHATSTASCWATSVAGDFQNKQSRCSFVWEVQTVHPPHWWWASEIF